MKNQEKNVNLQFSNQYNIQWFPGHMARTLRVMEQEIQHVDASLILLDARIPLSSLNPEIERITARKPRLYALNKADLADPAVTEEWIRLFPGGRRRVRGHQRQKPGRHRRRPGRHRKRAGRPAGPAPGPGHERGQDPGHALRHPQRGQIHLYQHLCGVGAGQSRRPPRRHQGQAVGLHREVRPAGYAGVLWKKFDSKTIASNLAFIGSIKDDILDVEELAMNLLDEVRRNYPELVASRYKLDAEALALPPYELMEAIGRKRGLLVRGGEVNTERCAIMLVDEFRACKWGRITLERPPRGRNRSSRKGRTKP